MRALMVAGVLAAGVLAAVAQTADAKPKSTATVDWARGLVTADGIGIADRHAPSPAVARGTSRRAAEDAARVQLAGKLGELPIAGGGTVAAHAKDAAVKARLDAAVAAAYAVDAVPDTDGSWRVTLAVPIEAVRQAVDNGARPLPSGGDTGAQIVVIDGAGAAQPAVGWTFGGTHAAAIFVAQLPEWAASAPHVQAGKIAGGDITLLPSGTVGAGTTATGATLFVVLTR